MHGLMRGCWRRDDGKPSLGHETGNGGYGSRVELNITAPVFYSTSRKRPRVVKKDSKSIGIKERQRQTGAVISSGRGDIDGVGVDWGGSW